MIPVVVKFAKEADADKFIAVITKAGATDIKKTPDGTGFIVSFNEPDDDDNP
jgi:hypothetical protein